MSSRSETFNILLLGKSGVGKSTLINAFANYFKFKILENAEKSDLINLIPSRYYLDSGDFFQPQIFEQGNPDGNEFVDSCCSTRKTNDHFVDIGNKIIRFIDTPWINDISPWCQEAGIFEKIMPSLPSTINIICVLLSFNEYEYMSESYTKYSIYEILNHFHKTAVNNIVFCITKTRKTDYKPGQVLEFLEEIFVKIKKFGCDFQLTEKNIYCVDNEALEYLCMMKNGISFSPEEKKGYKKSWETSFNEMQRLLQSFETVTPHFVKDSLALHETQKFISSMTKLQNYLRKQAIVEEEKFKELDKQLLELKYENGCLKRERTVANLKVISVSPSYLSTVCTSRKCTSTYFCKDTKKSIKIYSKRCHEYCWCASKSKEVSKSSQKICKIMDSQLMCINCGCHWNQHTTTNYKQSVETTSNQILSNISKIYDIEESLKNMANEKTKKKYEKICQLCSKFVLIIKMHGILPYNEITEEHYDRLITWFEGDGDFDEGKDLRNSLEEYNQRISIFDAHLKNTEEHLFEPNKLIFIPLEEFKDDFDVDLLSYILTKKSNPTQVITEMRMALLKLTQTDTNSEEEFLRQVFEMATKCQVSDEMAIPIFINGLKNDAVKNFFLNISQFPQSFEEMEYYVKNFSKITKETSTNAMPPKNVRNQQKHNIVKSKNHKKCYHCGSEKYHAYVKCYAKNEICKRCNLKGHVEDACSKMKDSNVVFNSKFKK